MSDETLGGYTLGECEIKRAEKGPHAGRLYAVDPEGEWWELHPYHVEAAVAERDEAQQLHALEQAIRVEIDGELHEALARAGRAEAALTAIARYSAKAAEWIGDSDE